MGRFPFSQMSNFAKKSAPFATAYVIVRVYYFFLLYTSIFLFQGWDKTLGPQTGIEFILPIAWIKFVEFPVAISLIRGSFIASSLLASIAPHWRIARILSFITLLEFVSLYFSTLQLDVDWYIWVLVAFLLIFLPDGWGNPLRLSQIGRQKFLLVFWACQAINLLTYSMSGIGKVLGAIGQILTGQSHVFEPKAAALHITDRLLKTNETSPLGPYVVDHYILAWPFFVGFTYLLLFSFVVAFKPTLHRIWGLGLILFHIASYLTINIGFSAHIFLNALLFLLSPFAPAKVSSKDIILDLPILGLLIKIIKKRK